MNMIKTCENCNWKTLSQQLWMDPDMAESLKNAEPTRRYSSETNDRGEVCMNVCRDCFDDLTKHIKDVKADLRYPYHLSAKSRK